MSTLFYLAVNKIKRLAFCASWEAVVLGDFNVPSLVWIFEDVVERYGPPTDLTFLECFTSAGLTWKVSESTFVSSDNAQPVFPIQTEPCW